MDRPGVRMIIMGRQGAGKGTQATRLAAACSVPHISTGDMLRAAVREGTDLGLRAKAIMDAGDLVPDEVMIGIVGERLDRDDANRGWILDGFPRTVGQAEALADITAQAPVDVVVELVVPNEIVVERLSARRTCDSCGTIYSVGDAAIADGVCPKCGGTPVQRDDDKPEAILHRLEVYERDTSPLLGHYRSLDLLESVDGLGSEDEVHARILAVVDARVASDPS
ncbi:adenylate kinase [Iamia sp. SCSIO 61187]|uniref:adenylate kinase n=1 Tax=Iamia sp. SCSIO 61187 TaxID=2722752 RepID=UPI001C625039|nr:adenylate kinase [Iamia sp. SCSIO 61187]QYG91592.1 adenylate kinase [Iamia sp. SCSIO 61187]